MYNRFTGENMKEKALKIIKSKYFIGTILTIILYLIYLALAYSCIGTWEWAIIFTQHLLFI